MTATWTAGHQYSIDDVVNPTTPAGFSYRCTTGGTSGGSEPSWVGRYQTITDGATVTWVVYSIVTPATVRSQLSLTDTTAPNTDDNLGGYIMAAIESLERATRRFLRNRPNFTYTQTSQTAATVPIPGLRTATSLTYANVTVDPSGYWLLPDVQNSGVYTGIQFRPFRSPENGPWWLVLGGQHDNWFDTAADNPFDPRNYGGGYVYTSMPNDQVTVGDWGYEPGFEPGDVVHAVEVLAEWYTLRPPAILADSAITAAGGIVSYSQMPPEVAEFCRKWSVGRQAVSVG